MTGGEQLDARMLFLKSVLWGSSQLSVAVEAAWLCGNGNPASQESLYYSQRKGIVTSIIDCQLDKPGEKRTSLEEFPPLY